MVKITQLAQLDLSASYSYADYVTWQLDETIELIKGKISLMAPAPNVNHQRLSMCLSGQMFSYFRHKPCQVFAAPFDVRLYDRRKSILASQDIITVVQPDICVICDPAKLDEQGCNGAPDWIIEIVSKGSSKNDAQIKHALYAESGVAEYWLVFPYEAIIEQFVLDEQGRYQLARIFAGDDQATPFLFPDLHIDLSELFPDS